MICDGIVGFGEAPAYRCGEASLSFAELDALSDRYAARLVVFSGGRVALLGGVEPEMPALMAACMKAGVCYIPCAEDIPAERLKAVLKASEARALVTAGKMVPGAGPGIQALTVNELLELPDAEHRIRGNDEAYAIFTSGSTGEPKGVVVTHGNLESFAGWFTSLPAVREAAGEPVVCAAPFSFDLSVAPLVQMLRGGGCYNMISRAELADFGRLFLALEGSGAALLVATPTFADLCLCDRAFCREMMPNLKTVFFCGEPLRPATVEKLFARFPDLRVLNAYGPTEATCAVSCSEITPGMACDPLPAGDIDEAAAGIEIGGDGIVVLSGASVAKGYCGAQQGGFIGGGRYVTGDRGSIKEGKLLLSGRNDRQIKLSGYRIELAEVERALCSLSYVDGALVTAVQSGGRVTALTAQVQCGELGVAPQQVLRDLEPLLPDYMRPKTVTIIQKPCMNGNGKRTAAN